MQLQKDIKQFEQAEIQIVGVSYDSVDILGSFAQQKEITYPLLSDTRSKVIDGFKLRNRRPGARHAAT